MNYHKLWHNLLPTIMFFLTLTIFSMCTTNVQAVVDFSNVAPSNDNVLKAAPNGIKIGNLFEYPTVYSGSKNINNSVQILKAGGSNPNPVDVIQMTGNEDNAVGSIWGRMTNPDDSTESYNYFDLTKEQTITGWIYVGPTFNVSGDGIALVLQNDDRGINAIGRYYKKAGLLSFIDPEKNYAASGESLGVYGGTSSPATVSNSTEFAGNAIQNSFALEFDSFNNSSSSAGLKDGVEQFNDKKTDDLFDALYDSHLTRETKGQHVAWAYPGDPDTYVRKMALTYYFFGMHHNNVIFNATIGGYDSLTGATGKDAWHHFTFTYKPDKDDSNYGYINYVYNDRETDGTVKPYHTWDKRPRDIDDPIKIDLRKFNLKDGQTKIRWGFTSSTGSPNSLPGYNDIVLEKIPAIADVADTSGLYDVTQKRAIKDLDRRDTNPTDSDSDYTVDDGDKLAFNYNLKYNSGAIGTGDITAELQLPQHVLYQNDSNNRIGEITYPDGPNSVTYISASQLTTSKKADGDEVQTLNLDLGALSKKSTEVNIKIYGTANAPISNTLTSTTVNPEHTSYKSDYYNADVMSYGFKITNQKLQIAASKDSETQKVKSSDGFKLEGTASYLFSSKFSGDDLSAYGEIFDANGKTTNIKSTWTVPVAKDASTGDYSLDVPQGTLDPGDYKIKVYLTDSQGLVSNTVTYNITVTDSELVITPDKTDITVNDNKPVTLSGSYKYSDDSQFKDEDATKTYEITNPDGTVHKITKTVTHDKKIDITLKPIAYDKPVTQTLDDYLKSPAEDNVLTEGKNTVKVTVQDGKYASASTTITVNVPKLTPQITAESNDLTVLGSSGNVYFPINFIYGSDYALNYHDLTGVFTVDDQTPINLKLPIPTEAQTSSFDMSFNLSGDQLKLPTDKNTSVVSVYFTDPYGRKTNTETFNLKILAKALELDFNNYRFKTIDPKSFKPGYISRSGNWDLNVTSYKAGWVLSAKADNLDYASTDEQSDLSMAFVNKDDLAIPLSMNPVIAKDSNLAAHKVDISNQWKSDNGILLKANTVPRDGDYKGLVNWNLTESL